MKIVHLIILLTPLGVFGLITTRIVETGGAAAFGGELARLGWFHVFGYTVGAAIIDRHFGPE